jgi:RimJ/RimL family protein N-acetyltransferase
MIRELELQHSERVRSLFQGLDYQLVTAAVIDGTGPGKIWVDDIDTPTTALLASAEGYCLAGYEDNSAVNRALNDLFTGIMGRGGLTRTDGEALTLVCDKDTWESKLDVVLRGRPPIREPRRHYLFDRQQVDWCASIPAGFGVKPIDGALLDQPGLAIPDHVTGWISANWGTTEHFLQTGFGFCTVHGEQLVCWCLADCVSGDACEIGIRTHPDYRRRGLATLTVAATVDYCLARGLKTIGWHCHEDNRGSQRVAEGVGFKMERTYVDYLCFYDQARHVAALEYYNAKSEALRIGKDNDRR